MPRKFFKKFSSIVFLGFLASILMANAAMAAPETTDAPAASTKSRKAKVYLNEPIGAGKEVFHVTKCEKIKKLFPLRCNNVTIRADGGKYKPQCTFVDGKDGGKEKTETGKYIQRCLDPASAQPTDASCKNKEFVQAPVWAVIGCPKEHCEDSEYVALEYFVSETELHTDEAPPYSDEENPRTFEDKYIGDYDDIAVERVYEIGSNEKGQPACKTGDFEVNDLKQVPGSGTLTLYDLGKFPECGSEHQSLIGDDKPAINCSRVELIEADSGTGLLSEFIGAIYRWAAGIIGVIAVLVIVISGIQISAAGGDSAKVDEAKNRILGSIAGLVLLFLSGLLLYTINPTFFTAT